MQHSKARDTRGHRNGRWKGGRCTRDGYVFLSALPDHPRQYAGRVLEHILIAERALGKHLPITAHVHHVNGDGTDNRPQNLVVCENAAYHKLMHRRQRAHDACGHAGWLKCVFCKQWDDPAHMYVAPNGRRAEHRACRKLDKRDKNAARKRRAKCI